MTPEDSTKCFFQEHNRSKWVGVVWACSYIKAFLHSLTQIKVFETKWATLDAGGNTDNHVHVP